MGNSMTSTEELTRALCSLSDSERKILVEFWDRQRRGQVVNASELVDIARPRMVGAVSKAFVKFRELGILQIDKARKGYWPRHHSPTDSGLQLIALILGTKRDDE